MFKFEIAFDEDKVLRENKYNIDEMYNMADTCFEMYGITKVAKGTYRSNGREKDLSYMWGIIGGLYNTKWFNHYVSKILWHDSKYDDVNGIHTRDVLSNFKKYGIGADV